MVSVAAAERCHLIENDCQRVMGRTTPAGKMGARAVLAVPVAHGDTLMGSLDVPRQAEALPASVGPRLDSRRVASQSAAV
jgi:hypothetical protein